MIRTSHALSISRFCAIVALPRSSCYRRLAAAAKGLAKGPWPAPEVERIAGRVDETATAYPAYTSGTTGSRRA